MSTLAIVKREHEELCREVLQTRTTLRPNDERFETRLTHLIQEMRCLSPKVASAVDYAWLRETASWWRIAFSSTFDALKPDVSLAPPEEPMPALSEAVVFTSEELARWLQSKAFELSKSRRLNHLLQKTIDDLVRMMPSSPGDMEEDWRQACMQFAYEVLGGGIHFARQMGRESYPLLEEECWLREAKKIKAYLIWERKGDGSDPSRAEDDYREACDYFRAKLLDGPKCPPSEFEPVRTYLEHRYLRNKKIDWDKPEAAHLLEVKKRRMMEARDWPGHFESYARARTYVTAFYEHIIPAVMKGDEASVGAVLEAFSAGGPPADADLPVNCFEMAIAIYFLDPAVVVAVLENGGIVP